MTYAIGGSNSSKVYTCNLTSFAGRSLRNDDLFMSNGCYQIFNNSDSLWVHILKTKYRYLYPWTNHVSTNISRSQCNIKVLIESYLLKFF